MRFICLGMFLFLCLGEMLSFASDNKPPKINFLKRIFDNFHSVQRGVFYRSAQLSSSRLAKYIRKHGIKTLINLRGENKNCRWWQSEKKVAESLDVKFYNLGFSARTLESKESLYKLLNIYKTSPRPILVHCRSGIDRTGEASALWVLEQQHLGKRKALKQLSLRYGYFKFKHPAKYFLVKHWNSLETFENTYNS